jgi:hypothetical protein
VNAAAVPATSGADLARAELALAAEGRPVFPLVTRGKEPAIPRWKGGRGVYDATTDEDVIRQRRQQYPLANIGLAVQEDEVVVDLDSAEGLEVLRTAGNPLPATACSRTARGWHYWYQLPAGVQLRNGPTSLPHVEFKSFGGYVVAPPSVHPSGFVYTWITPLTRENIAPAPEWILALVGREEQRQPTPPPVWRELVRQGVSEGRRNKTIARLAGHLLRRRVDPFVTLELLAAWNAARCRPPLADDEVEGTVRSIARSELERRGGAR